MSRPTKPISITQEQRKELKGVLSRLTTPLRHARRARLILLRSEGLSRKEVSATVGIAVSAVQTWESRFLAEGLAGLIDRKGRGRKASIPAEVKASIITDCVRPPSGKSRWSVRSMAKAKGVSSWIVQKLWIHHDIKPHLTKTFKISNDPRFEEKFWDVVGLYLSPPEKGLVLCCDEKSQCQALERSQPGLPLGVGHIRTATHDYYRHGTTTLFAALELLEGTVTAVTAPSHTHLEWLGFLKLVDKQMPPELTLHIVLDNYSTHKHEKVMDWIDRRNTKNKKKHQHNRFVFHFTPTSGSWLNLVERFFGEITREVIRDGSFLSVPNLISAIMSYIHQRNHKPVPFRWRADPANVLAKVMRARQALARVVQDKTKLPVICQTPH